MPASIVVFVDANVLYSRCLRDWLVLMSLESDGTAYRLRWSEAVLAETFYHLRRRYPDAPEQQIERWRDQLEQKFPEAKVTHWNPGQVPRPRDPNDHHVLAAAYGGNVDMLVTHDGDIQDFQRCLDSVDAHIDVRHIDDFLCLIAGYYPELVQQRYVSQVKYWQRRHSVTLEAAADLSIEALDKAGAERFAFLLGTDERFRLW